MKRKSRKLKSKPQPQSEGAKEMERRRGSARDFLVKFWVGVRDGKLCGSEGRCVWEGVRVCVYHDNLLKAQPFVHTTTQSILNFRLPHLYLLLFFAQRRVQGRAKRGGWGSQRGRRERALPTFTGAVACDVRARAQLISKGQFYYICMRSTHRHAHT